MKAKFNVGEVLTVNDAYRRQGSVFFGKDLKHRYFIGKVLKVCENTNDQTDGSGNVWPNVYIFRGGLSICESFLRRA